MSHIPIPHPHQSIPSPWSSHCCTPPWPAPTTSRMLCSWSQVSAFQHYCNLPLTSSLNQSLYAHPHPHPPPTPTPTTPPPPPPHHPTPPPPPHHPTPSHTTPFSVLIRLPSTTWPSAKCKRPVSQMRAPPGGLSRTSGKLWQDYSNCYMLWT